MTGCSTGLFPAPHPDASFPTSPTAAAADDDDWARTLAADLTVPAALMRRAMPFMVARSGKGEGYDDSTGAQGGGVIVNIIATTTPGPPLSVAAAAAGAGLVSLSSRRPLLHFLAIHIPNPLPDRCVQVHSHSVPFGGRPL